MVTTRSQVQNSTPVQGLKGFNIYNNSLAAGQESNQEVVEPDSEERENQRMVLEQTGQSSPSDYNVEPPTVQQRNIRKLSKNQRMEQYEIQLNSQQQEIKRLSENVGQILSILKKGKGERNGQPTDSESELEGEEVEPARQKEKFQGNKDKSVPVHKAYEKPSAKLKYESRAHTQTLHIARPVPLRVFNVEDDPESFLRQFKKYAQRNGIEEDDWLDEVRDGISSRAQTWFDRNLLKFQDDFDVFCTLFVKHFRKDPYIYESRLFFAKQKPDESLRMFLKRLEDIARPANLNEQKLRQAFLMNIYDRALCEYARHTYLYLNQDIPLEQIMYSLEDKESSIKYNRYRTEKNENGKKPEYRQKPTYRSGPSSKYSNNSNKSGSQVKVLEEENTVQQLEENEELGIIDERLEESSEEQEVLVLEEVFEVPQTKINSNTLEEEIVNQAVQKINYERHFSGLYFYKSIPCLQPSVYCKRMCNFSNLQAYTRTFDRYISKNFLVSLYEAECQFDFCSTNIPGIHIIKLLNQSSTLSLQSSETVQSRLWEKLIEQFEDNKLLKRKYFYKSKSAVENQQKEMCKNVIAGRILLTLLQRPMQFYYVINYDLIASTFNGFIILTALNFVYTQFISAVVRTYTPTWKTNFYQIRLTHIQTLLSAVCKGKYIMTTLRPTTNKPQHIISISDRQQYCKQKYNLINLGAQCKQVSEPSSRKVPKKKSSKNRTLLRLRRLEVQNNVYFWIVLSCVLTCLRYVLDTLSAAVGCAQQYVWHQQNDQQSTQQYDQQSQSQDIEYNDTVSETNSSMSQETYDGCHEQQINVIDIDSAKQQTRKTAYIPDQSAVQFSKSHMPQLSLHQILQNSTTYQDEWLTYLRSFNKNDTINKVAQEQYVVPTPTPVVKQQDIMNTPGWQIQYQPSSNSALKYISIQANNIQVNALVDTGCSRVVVSKAFLEKHNLLDQLVEQERLVTTAESQTLKVRHIWPNVRLTLLDNIFSDVSIVTDLLVMNGFNNYDVIIGQTFLNFFRYQMNSDTLDLLHPVSNQKVSLSYTDSSVLQVEETYQIHQPSISVFTQTTQPLFTETQCKLYPSFPTDKRDLFLIDPPWTYIRNEKGIRLPPHPTLTLEELQQLPIQQVSKQDAILLLWTTGPMFKNAMTLIITYGFYFKTVLFTWVKLDKDGKPQKGKGAYTDPCCEFLLIATKGNYQKLLKQNPSVSQFLSSTNLKESRKPTVQYKKLEQLFFLEKTNNLEVFSRQPPGSEKFSHYGNEVQEMYQQAITLCADQVNLLNDLQKLEEQVSPLNKGGEHEGPFETNIFSPVYMSQEELEQSYEPEQLKTYQQVLAEINVQNIAFQEIVQSFKHVFSRGDSDIGSTDLVEHHIQLVPDAQPKKQRPYKMGGLEIKAIDQIVSDTLQIGVIKEEPSPYLHPVVLVKKPNGKYRMCINFKYLNSLTVDDKYPIPLISYILQSLSKSKIFSKLDAKSGFWQIRMSPESVPLTGFITTKGQYVYLRMPFGLKNAPATFQRLMNLVFKDFIGHFVIVYIDDIIIYSESIEAHKKHLKLVFQKLQEVCIKLGGDKCVIGTTEIDILGHTIREGEILPQSEKIRAIREIQDPQSKTELRAFLGLCGYYRQFIPKFAQIAHPLYPLIGNSELWEWGEKQSQAVTQLKDAIADNAVLGMLQNDKQLILYTDFSILGLGAVLSQKVSDKKEKVIEFASRTLQKYERHLDSYCGEVLAVYWAVQKFRQYILSVPFSLVIVTDNKALEWVLKLGTTSPIRKIQRWTMEIDSYSYTVKHRKGTNHVNADALSRLVGQLPPELNLEKEQILSNDIHTQVLHMEDIGDLACSVCRSPHEKSPMLICDRCADAYHQDCASVHEIPEGLWYCLSCQQYIQQNYTEDVTYNKPLFEYLVHVGDSPMGDGFSEEDRILRISKSLPRGLTLSNFLVSNHRLYFKSNQDNILLIPSITERDSILKEQHVLSGHSGISRTQDKILQQYWWEHLHRDVTDYVKSCEICNVTAPKFSQQPQLHTTSKGLSPFQVLAADLITNLQDVQGLSRDEELPVTDEDIIVRNTRNKGKQAFGTFEYKHCIVVIDVFSKHVELGALKSKSSEEIAQWFAANILCRYGTPYVLRTDQGTEFLGALETLCADHSIETRKISSHYPQANGQAERTVQTVTKILRRFLLSKHYSHLHWWEILPYVQRSINTTNSSTTELTPHEVVYGRKMYITDSVNYTTKSFQEQFPELSESIIKDYVSTLHQSLAQLQTRVKMNLKKMDQRMREAYEKKEHTELNFSKGQRVYVQRLRLNKLAPRVFGPFIFQKYNPDRITAEVIDPDTGKSRRFNTNTMAPASLVGFIFY